MVSFATLHLVCPILGDIEIAAWGTRPQRRSKRGPSTTFRARMNRGRNRNARNSAQDDGARESGADGEQVAKHVRRARCIVPLRDAGEYCTSVG